MSSEGSATAEFIHFVRAAKVRDAMVGPGSGHAWENWELVEIPSTQSVPDTVRSLARHHITAAPVRFEKTGQLGGFISTHDLVLMKMFLAHSKEWLGLLVKEDIDHDDFVRRCDLELANSTAEDVVDAGERNPWVTIDVDAPLTQLMGLMSKNQKLHRVGVVNSAKDKTKVVGIVSQMGVIRHLYSLAQGKDVARRTMSEIVPEGKTPVLTTTLSERAVDAFTRMMEEKVSALPVVDDKDKIIDVLSTTDVIQGDQSIARFYKPVRDFLNRPAGFEVATLAPSSTVNEALELLAQTKRHRLFITHPDSGRTISVLSLSDAIRGVLADVE